MGKLVVTQIVSPLKNILHDILKVAPPSGRRCLAAKLIKRLAGTGYVGLYGIIAAVA